MPASGQGKRAQKVQADVISNPRVYVSYHALMPSMPYKFSMPADFA